MNRLIPATKRDCPGLKKGSALRAFVRLFPEADAVPKRGGTGRLEFDPTSPAARRQAIYQGGKPRYGFGIIFLRRRRFELNHCVVEFLAIGAQDGLDGNVPAAIRAARYPRAITASVTFEEIRAAHKPFADTVYSAAAFALRCALRCAPSEG